eukprot:2952690-Amphidinium_carterae.1
MLSSATMSKSCLSKGSLQSFKVSQKCQSPPTAPERHNLVVRVEVRQFCRQTCCLEECVSFDHAKPMQTSSFEGQLSESICSVVFFCELDISHDHGRTSSGLDRTSSMIVLYSLAQCGQVCRCLCSRPQPPFGGCVSSTSRHAGHV